LPASKTHRPQMTTPLDALAYDGPLPELPDRLGACRLFAIEDQRIPENLRATVGMGWSGRPLAVSLLRCHPSAVAAVYAAALPDRKFSALAAEWPLAALARAAFGLYARTLWGGESAALEWLANRR